MTAWGLKTLVIGAAAQTNIFIILTSSQKALTKRNVLTLASV